MSICWLDIEAYSEEDLKKSGVYVYAKHPSTRITLLAYAIGEGPVHVWDVTTGTPMPADLQAAINDPEVIVCAHNSQFDRVVLRDAAGINIPIERWVDSMVRAMSHALPGALADLGKAMGLPENQQKMREGHALMLKFCKPAPVNHKVRIYDRENSPEKWAKFIEYARQDVAAMRRLWHMMPNLNYPNGGLAEWHEDQHINDHGFAVDVELTKAGAAATDVERVLMTDRLLELTRGIVKKPTDRNGLLSFLNGTYNLGLPDLTKDTLSRELLKDDIPKTAREVIELRLAGNKTSTAKYAALDRATGSDGRFRGGLQFAGAGRTRRYAGRIFQPQNLPSRGLPPASMVEAYIDALKAGVHDLIFDDLTLYGAAALRGCVIAPPGKKLVQADLSNIEGRILAWVAGEHWKLQAFREYDAGTGPDLYNITATSIIGGDPWKVPKKNRNVFGKVPDLACFAANVLVLTSTGFKPIVGVLPTDLLWDGVEWIQHDGVVAKGVRPVISLDGIEVTPDHLIRTGQTWTRAQQLASNESMRSLALVTGSENLPFADMSPGRLVGFSTSWPSALAGQNRTRSISATFAQGKAHDVTCAPRRKAPNGLSTTGATRTLCRIMSTVVGYLTGLPRALGGVLGQKTRPTLITAGAGYGCAMNSLIAGPSLPISSPWMGGINQNSNLTERMSTGGTRGATCGSSPSDRTGKTNEPCKNSNAKSKNLRPVFDIMNAGPRNRFTVVTASGFLIAHNCGYRGGVPGFQTFAHAYRVRMADHWDTIQSCINPAHVAKAKDNLKEPWAKAQITTLEISDTEWLASETCKLAWRARHPATVDFWGYIQDACFDAMENPGVVFVAGKHIAVKKVTVQNQSWLLIKLPSNRYLTYYDPKIVDGNYGPTLSYMGMASDEGSTSRAWIRCYTHGGKLTGNICQTLARDVLVPAIARGAAAGYDTILSVHDELVCEADDIPERNHEELSSIMAQVPVWADGLPLAAAGFTAYRYKKED